MAELEAIANCDFFGVKERELGNTTPSPRSNVLNQQWFIVWITVVRYFKMLFYKYTFFHSCGIVLGTSVLIQVLQVYVCISNANVSMKGPPFTCWKRVANVSEGPVFLRLSSHKMRLFRTVTDSRILDEACKMAKSDTTHLSLFKAIPFHPQMYCLSPLCSLKLAKPKKNPTPNKHKTQKNP